MKLMTQSLFQCMILKEEPYPNKLGHYTTSLGTTQA